MNSITITEALAEIKTIGKRLEKKRVFISQYLLRQEQVKDPLEKDGGSPKIIEREMQAIRDLQERIIKIREQIQRSNLYTLLTIDGTSRSVANWLTWRKEVAIMDQKLVNDLRHQIENVRVNARKQGVTVGMVNVTTENSKPTDILVNIDEGELVKRTEQLETTLGTLDGKLSLLNATTFIDLD